MKHLKLFEDYQDIDAICKKYKITNYSINSDGSIDVDGGVKLSEMDLKRLPLKFREVTGYFDCSFNMLTSLEGAPGTVGNFFNCIGNQLTSLEGGPQSVGGNFLCNNNQLKSFEGAPSVVNGYFDCENNQLTFFDGLPETIGKGFYCYGNPLRNIWVLFQDKSLIEYFNEFDCIRGNELIIDRLNAFLDEIGKPNVESVNGYKNI